MSGEIKVQQGPIISAIDQIRSTIQSLERSISIEIEGDTNLETVKKFNELKAGYDNLLNAYEALVVKNAQSRSEEHTSELQSRFDLVCRLLLEKKNTKRSIRYPMFEKFNQ